MCPPIVGHTIKVNCNFKGKGISCDEYVEPGTTAKITCAVMYELPQNTLVHEDLICQLDGNWDYSAFTCEQTCGTIETKTAFSLKSQITKIHKVPWHTAIYWKNETGKFEQLCGGTIIYPNVIISAAHCFWNTQTSSLNNESDYIVAAGKFYRDFYAKNEPENVQIRTIQQINTAIQFSGSDYDYLGDIAVLLLHDHIEFKSHIRPACVTWKNYNDRFISSNVPGIVAGWGITESGANSEELRSVELLSLDGESCKLRVSKFNKISNDKFCVETSEGKNVCSGDSGGGFLVPVPINGTIYYHLWGIVSNGFKNQNDNVHICNSKFTTNFVNIQYYKDLVTQSVKNFSLVTHNNSGCLIPTKRYLILTDSQSETILEPGTYIKSLTSVKYACKENALLEGESHTNLCDGNWVQPHPKCIKLCPPIKAFNMNVLCYKKRIGVSCNKPVQPGTVAKISCAFIWYLELFEIQM
ncbi:modular serine protease-like [Condylostylus longicornis]|uniref:modular serine protease-like n=1 Tax=Condylostylus longicornis TaxID=2530218 RepID=UPI00244E4334|nr:modular serine protease-like [Condylostylus longicornis]